MSDVTCRGSFALGTACRRCSKCKAEIEEYEVRKTVRESLDGTSVLKMQVTGWQNVAQVNGAVADQAKAEVALLTARLAKAEMDSRSYQAMATDAIHRMDNAQAEVARLTAQLSTARRDALDDVLQSVGEMLAGTPEKDVSPAARGKIRAAIIRALIAQEEPKT